jgi:hypothetical protein
MAAQSYYAPPKKSCAPRAKRRRFTPMVRAILSRFRRAAVDKALIELQARDLQTIANRMRNPSISLVLALFLVGAAGCKSSAGTSAQCAGSTLTLHLAWSEAAASDEVVHVLVPLDVPAGSAGDPFTTQTFPVPIGAVQMDVVLDVSHFAFGQSLGVSISHGSVTLMVASTNAVRDTCSAVSIDDWTVDAAIRRD